MTTPTDLPYWLALLRAPNLTTQTFLELTGYFKDLGSLFRNRSKECPIKLHPNTISYLKTPNWHGVELDLNWLKQSSNHHILTYLDEHYPLLLKEIPNPPPILFVNGSLACLNYPQLAMVGSRKATPAGKETAFHLAAKLGAAGLAITSGLAIGIDTAAHLGALETHETIAAVATGLDLCYPKQNTALAERICQQGAIISEAPCTTLPLAQFFPKRNRLISGLSLGTLVVEANTRSGSLITAAFALEQGRDVFAIPGSIHNAKARGCHALLKQGATLVETEADILEALAFFPRHPASKAIKIKGTDYKTLERDHLKLLECIEYEPTKIDLLVERSNHSISKITSILVDLELAGCIYSTVEGYMRVLK